MDLISALVVSRARPTRPVASSVPGCNEKGRSAELCRSALVISWKTFGLFQGLDADIPVLNGRAVPGEAEVSLLAILPSDLSTHELGYLAEVCIEDGRAVELNANL